MAMFIAAFVALHFLPGVVTSSRAVTKATSAEAGIQLVHQKIESLRDGGFAALPTVATGQTAVTQTFVPACDLLDPAGTLTVERVDSAFSPTTVESNRRLVTVTVTWREPGRSTTVSSQSKTLMVNI